MRVFLIIVLLFGFLQAIETNEILLLHSYNKGLKWSDGISKGVESVMQKHPQYELTTEYMDSKKIVSNSYFEELFGLYKKKFASRKYKAVIVADNYAYEFALANHDEFFKDTPIVFCGVENFNPDNIEKHMEPYVTGVVEYKDIKKNIELIYQAYPAIKTLYIISDSTFSSLSIQDQIKTEAKAFADKFNIIFDNMVDLKTIDEKLNKLPKESAILFTSLYVDVNEKYVPYSKLQNFFSHSRFPIFALNKIHLGEGVVGGFMITPFEQGELAAKKAFEIILEQKKPSDIPISTPSGKPYFDYPLVIKYPLLVSLLPADTIFINYPKSFFEKNKKI
ncbi:MAG: ABC transporter substrate binding protein, partial [Sulfurospirillaceae bacterium]|nr:ABC transporter substrate binding protein [Sulfurospirillaceae bacterium]